MKTFDWEKSSISSTVEIKKNTPLNNKEIEEYSFKHKLYKERNSLIEKREENKESIYKNAKNLLIKHPQKTQFYNYKWDFYSEISNIDEIDDIQKKWFIVYVPKISRKELEKIVSEYEKEQTKLNNIKTLLSNNPNTKTFYKLDWKYYSTNPTRVPWNDVNSVLRIQEVDRSEMESKIDKIEKWSIESYYRRLDNMIDNSKQENLKKFLIELRIWISLNDNNSDISLLLWESLGNLLNLLEKSQNQLLNVNELLSIIWYSLNILRSWVSDTSNVIISFLKDITSSKLFKFWKDKSDIEQQIQNFFNNWDANKAVSLLKYILDENEVNQIKKWWIEARNIAVSIPAWAIDWFLDYIQSGVDIAIMPDKVLQNFKDIISNWFEANKETLKEIEKSFENIRDFTYVWAYIFSIIAAFIMLPTKYWILWLPQIIVKWLKTSWLISTKNLNNIEWYLVKNISWLVDNTGKKLWYSSESAKNISEKWTKITEKTRDWIDSANTLKKSLEKQAELIKKSKQALEITNNSVRLAEIFGNKMQESIWDKASTDIAMKAYREAILKWNWFSSDDIDVLIEKTSWEVKYNLIRVREKLTLIEKVIDKEVVPIWNNFNINVINKNNLWIKNIQIQLKNNSWNYNELSREIFKKYIIKK